MKGILLALFWSNIVSGIEKSDIAARIETKVLNTFLGSSIIICVFPSH